MKGTFIAIEGIDGCGKGTVIKRLAAELFQENKNSHVFLTREPYRREWMRKYLSTINPEYRGEEALLLFLKDRKEHVKIIKIMLKKGVIVLSDRYKHSTYAYQMAQGMSFEKIHEMHKGLPVPDITIIIDITTEEAEKRLLLKTEEQSHAFNKKEMLQKARQNYLQLKELLKEPITYFNGMQDREKTYEEIKKKVIEVLARQAL